jgi:CRISPR-associated exonuclease Cas4
MWIIEGKTYISPSDVMEYLYCPRFIYFMYCLDLIQNEKARDKVLKGRHIHELRAVRNKDYLRKRIGVVDKEIDVNLVSDEYGVHGVVDEVLTLEDKTLAPLDYKFAEYKGTMFRTHRYQAVLYAIMIEEQYGETVNRGYICYIRSKNRLEEIKIEEKHCQQALKIVAEARKIINKGFFPEPTGRKRRCIDCTYNSVCVGAKISV